MAKFYIEKLLVTGDGKEPSSVEFCSGLNFIVGPSNTGKSYILECIDYLFGFEEKKNKPFRFDKGLGYDCFKLYTQTSNGTVIFERQLDSSKIIVSGTNPDFEKGEYSVNSSAKKRIRDVWCQMMGVDSIHKIYRSKTGNKQAFTWRSILHMFFLRQEHIARTSSVLLAPSNYYSDTASKWALLFMISGTDADSSETTENKSIRKAKKDAIMGYIKGTVKRLALRESELLQSRSENSVDLQMETRNITAEINSIQSQINEAISNSRQLLKDIYACNSKLTECETISERFSVLRHQYRSDIKRLTFILEGEKGKANLPVNPTCPFCDNQISNRENVSYLEAASAELNHIRTHLTELEKAEGDISDERKGIQSEIRLLENQKSEVDVFVNKKLKPQMYDLNKKLENYRMAIQISNEIDVIQREERLLSAELFDKETEGEGLVVQYDYRQYFEHEMISAFENRLTTILKACNYKGYSSARFNMDTFDLEVNGRHKAVSNGGGYCGFLNTIVALALMEYLNENGQTPPGLLIADSPVTQLSESEFKDDAESMKTSLFRYLLENHNNGQIIIVEQKENMPKLRYLNYSDVKTIEFTKDKTHGRYGFLNSIYEHGQ